MKVRREAVGEERSRVAGAWDRFWFTPADPIAIAAIRISVGLILLYAYAACSWSLAELVGPGAWVDTTAIEQIRGLGNEGATGYASPGARWWGESVWFYVRQPAWIGVLHAAFLLAIVAFTIGLWSRVTSVLVWVGHLSYVHRGFFTFYGMDSVLAMLTFYLLFAPTGAALSVDRLVWRWREARRALAGGDVLRFSPPRPSWSANVVLRMIQVHMAIVYLCSGLAKLQGARWWDGTAVWMTIMLHEFAPFDMGWLAQGGDMACHLVSNVGVALTLVLEIGFAFLIWNRALRPVMLALALVLHVGIGVAMGMSSFGLVMLTGCLSFVEPESVRRVAVACGRGRRGDRFAWDPTCPVQARAARWIAALDCWDQIELVKLPAAPAGGLIAPDGTVLHGRQAAGQLMLRLRTLWLAWPLAIWTLLSLRPSAAPIEKGHVRRAA